MWHIKKLDTEHTYIVLQKYDQMLYNSIKPFGFISIQELTEGNLEFLRKVIKGNWT